MYQIFIVLLFIPLLGLPNIAVAVTTGGASDEFSIATQNLQRFFDTQDDKSIREPVMTVKRYQHKLSKLAAQVSLVLNNPDIVAVQEVENLTTLRDLADKASSSGGAYSAYLKEGHDRGGIDVGFLVKDTVAVKKVSQIFKDVRFYFDGSYLFDRPPLHMRLTLAGLKGPALSIVVVHNRSFYGLNKPTKHKRVKKKRDEQARWLGKWINRWQNEHPNGRLIVLGDFNALTNSSEMRLIKQYLPKAATGKLLNLSLKVEKERRYSYVYKKKKEALDHILITENLESSITRVYFTQGNTNSNNRRYWYDKKSPLRSSDHEGLVVTFNKKECCM